MSEHLDAGTSRSGPLWQDDYLAPLAIPTGEKPADVLNVIWRKNDVFIDIGSWALGSAVMVIWPSLMLAMYLLHISGSEAAEYLLIGYAFMFGPAILIILYSLTKPVPPPIRFNRQRREVCVPQKDGTYWFVPWESVKAVGTAVSSVGQHGRSTQGLLVLGFPNPNPNHDGKSEEGKEYSLALSCGGGRTAMVMWECIRSFMEVGPEAVPPCTYDGTQRQGFLSMLWMMLSQVGRKLKEGEVGGALYDLFFIVCLGAPLAGYLQVQKLAPPPDLAASDVIEWSKPLPPEQWAKRSSELDRAIREREVDLAIEREQG